MVAKDNTLSILMEGIYLSPTVHCWKSASPFLLDVVKSLSAIDCR